MDRSERFYRIEAMIKARGCVDFATLLAELEVSPATLKRDFQYLRDRMDAPIVWDATERGYRLEPVRGGRLPVQHELPGVWFSEREIHALLTMHQLIEGLDEGGVLSRHLQPLLDKLQGMLGATQQEASSLMQRIRIVSPGRRPVPVKWFELFGDALVRRRRVHMRYASRGRRAMTERDVSPQRMVHHRNTWYLDAWCHLRERLLRFALDAVQSAAILDRKARDVPLRAVQAELDAGYGIFAGRQARWATLRFSADAARWVAREELHPHQKGRTLPDGAYELKVPYADETELVMDILRHGPQVEVLAPEPLAAAVRARLRAALEVAEGRLPVGAAMDGPAGLGAPPYAQPMQVALAQDASAP